MISVISPAKTLDFESPIPWDEHSQPQMLDRAQKLVRVLKALDEPQLGALMNLSPKLATLNAERFREWSLPFSQDNARQAIFAFKGDVYTGFNFDLYEKKDFGRMQGHLRILSGLYGVLSPLDLIQPYRLEMGTPLANGWGKDLYAFWGSQIGESLQQQAKAVGARVLVNLASKEYFKAVDLGVLDLEVISPVFLDEKNGSFKIISFYAKKARGAMADFLIRNRVTTPEQLRAFRGLGYEFDAERSSPSEPVFTRGEQ